MGRILLEHAYPYRYQPYPHVDVFVTLTYDDDHVPLVEGEEGEIQRTLDPSHTRNWLKRYRKYYGPVRYYLVGEYGSKTKRPHYHAILFGRNVDVIEEQVRATWRFGDDSQQRVSVLNSERAAYAARYTLKKMTRSDDNRLGMRYPEYCRQSRKPPLGARGWEVIRDTLYGDAGSRLLSAGVPTEFRIGGKRYPLGRYWRERIREEFNVDAPKITREDYAESETAAYREAQAVELDKARLSNAKAERRYNPGGSI